MQSYTRHQLKQDKFANATKEAVHWTAEHRNTIITAVAIAAIALAGFLAWTYYQSRQEDQASFAFGNAVRTYSSSLRPAGEAAQPDSPVRTFASVSDRAAAAFTEFQQIAEKYPHTKNGQFARYMAGVTALEKGDTSAGEDQLKKAADSDKSTATLAKFALAELYRSQDKTDQAAKMYREVIDANAATVSKSQAQVALAEMYESKNPTEAVKVYEQIIKDEQATAKETAKGTKQAKTPNGATQQTPLEQYAESKIQQLKSAAGKK